MALLFNNNFEFNHRNSASPSICLKAININLPNISPATFNIINTFNYGPNDFKYFFKIWPNINNIVCPDVAINNVWRHIANLWENTPNQDATYNRKCQGLNYERTVYQRLDGIRNNNDPYTIVPMLAETNNVSILNLSRLLNMNITDPDYRLFVFILCSFLQNPNIPQQGFDYNMARIQLANISDITRRVIDFIGRNVTFSCIIIPVIRAPVFHTILQNLKIPAFTQNLMQQFCGIFVNIVRGIQNLKQRNISHNDLHSGNIFVQRRLDGTFNTYIFDFDRSYSPMLGDNPLLNSDICARTCNINQCNRYDNWLDFFKILHYVLASTPRIFQLLFLGIITDSPNNILFDPFIQLMIGSDFLTSRTTNCSWYFDTNMQNQDYKNRFQVLLVNYDTVIDRLTRYGVNVARSAFSFAPPQSNNKMLNKIENIKGKSDLLNKMPSNKLKLFFDLTTGKYIDTSIKEIIPTSIKEFDDLMDRNNTRKYEMDLKKI
jgi:hypothetical protein